MSLMEPDAPIASTSRLTAHALQTDVPRLSISSEGAADLPTLAQLLQETIRAPTRRSTTGSDVEVLSALPSLSSSSSKAYLDSLLSRDLSSLLREPNELRKQGELLDAELANLCYRCTGDLLGVGESVDSVQDGFGQLGGALESLLGSAEQLAASCSTFSSTSTPILKSRGRLQLVRSHMASIEDLLNIPRLVSTCVRGGWWNEALDLAARTRDLERTLGQRSKSLPSRRDLLGKVREDVDSEIQSLRIRVLEGLRMRGLKLPSAVRSIALLRRMNARRAPRTQEDVAPDSAAGSTLSEPQLRMAFVTSRWDCLLSQLEQTEIAANSGSSPDDRLRYNKRWLELWREMVGETVTMYNELFSRRTKEDFASDAHIHQQHEDCLSVFLQHVYSALQQFIRRQLTHFVSISMIANLQTQLAYCSAAFSKFGFEFRSLIDPVIAHRVEMICSERFAAASEQFLKDLLRAQVQAGAKPGKSRLVLGALHASEAKHSVLALDIQAISEAGDTVAAQPSSYIALFPPLAKFMNAHAIALNDLRMLPLQNISHLVHTAQMLQLVAATRTLLQFLQVAIPSIDESIQSLQMSPRFDGEQQEAEIERQRGEALFVLQLFTTVHCKVILPWCRWALMNAVYPELQHGLQEHAGSLATQLQKLVEQCLETAGLTESRESEAELTLGHVENGEEAHAREHSSATTAQDVNGCHDSADDLRTASSDDANVKM